MDSHCKFSGVSNILRCALLFACSPHDLSAQLRRMLTIAPSMCQLAPPAHQFCSYSRCNQARRHVMLPRKPAGVSDELWTLELPSILGMAHGDVHESPEPPPTPSPAQCSEESAEDPVLPSLADQLANASPPAAHSAAPHFGSTAPSNN